MTYCKNNWVLHWILAGFVLGIGFIFPSAWWLGLLGVAGVIHLTLQSTSLKQAMLGGLIAWTIKSALALIWFWSVYPLDWLGVELGYWQLPLIFTWWATGSLWLGFGGVFFAAVCLLLLRYTSLVVTYLAIPFVWICSEMFGSLVFSIITIGPGGSITTAFSFGYIGYLLAEHSLLVQGAQIAGVYSLGVLLVFFATALYFSLTNSNYRAYGLVILTVLVVTSFIPLPEKTTGSDFYKVAIIDTQFGLSQWRTQSGRKVVQAKLEAAVQAALATAPDYILLPEDARYFNQQNDAIAEAAQFAFRTGSSEVIIVDSGRANEIEKAVVQSFVYNGKEQVVDQSHKRYLVPQGEFMPSLYMAALKLFGRNEVVDQFAKTVAFEVGSQTSQRAHSPSSPGILFCFESVSPWGVQTILRERGSVPFIAHPVSHAWFNEPRSLRSQLTHMLRVQAIWNQQQIISSGNGVPGQVFTPDGSVRYPEPVNTGDGWQLGVATISN